MCFVAINGFMNSYFVYSYGIRKSMGFFFIMTAADTIANASVGRVEIPAYLLFNSTYAAGTTETSLILDLG